MQEAKLSPEDETTIDYLKQAQVVDDGRRRLLVEVYFCKK